MGWPPMDGETRAVGQLLLRTHTLQLSLLLNLTIMANAIANLLSPPSEFSQIKTQHLQH